MEGKIINIIVVNGVLKNHLLPHQCASLESVKIRKIYHQRGTVQTTSLNHKGSIAKFSELAELDSASLID
jgi:hypothetical protein